MKVALVGMGPGNPALLTGEAREAIGKAELLIGSKRLLEPFLDTGTPCREAVAPAKILGILQEGPAERAAVLLSGDTGFYSGTKGLLPLLREAGIETEILCGISSLQFFCARLGLPWEEVHSASAHGRDCDPVGLVSRFGTVFFLTGPQGEQSPQGICAALAEAGRGEARAWVGSRLSYPDEKIVSGTAGELADGVFPPLSVLLIQESPVHHTPFGIPDGAFLRGEVPMTKEEVRSAVLGKLRPAPGDTLWDVGAGTGSVAVGMALLSPEGRVYAVERKEEACDLIRQNARRFGAGNLTVIQGTAPAVLADLPAPQAIFVGGSGGNLEAILEAALAKNPKVRVVIAAVTLETLTQAAAAFSRLPFGEVETVQLTVARAQKAGRYHLLAGQNPVFLLSGEGSP